MLALLCETACFLSLRMKRLLRSCTRHSKTTSALSNQNFLELISQYLIMLERYFCSFYLFYCMFPFMTLYLCIYLIIIYWTVALIFCLPCFWLFLLCPGDISGWYVSGQKQGLCGGRTSGSVDSLKMLLCGRSIPPLSRRVFKIIKVLFNRISL